MEQCACASPERKLLQRWLQLMLAERLERPRVVAFVVSLLIIHLHTHIYLYLALYTNIQGHLSLCSVVGHFFRRKMTYWPVRTWLLSVGCVVAASHTFAGQCSCFSSSQPQCAKHSFELESLFA